MSLSEPVLIIILGMAAVMSALSLIVVSVFKRRARELREELLRVRAQDDEAARIDLDGPAPEADGPDDEEEPRQRDTPIMVPDALVDAWVHDNVVLFIGPSTLVRDNAPSRAQLLGAIIDASRPGADELPSGRQTASPIFGGRRGLSAGSSRGSLRSYMRRHGEDAVTDILAEEIGVEEFARFARDAFAHAAATPALETLCRQTSVAGFVSTGLDDVVARAAAGVIVTPRSTDNFEKFVRGPERVVLALNGDLDLPGTLSLTASQLKQAIQEAPDLRSLLLSYLSGRTALFIGMSFREIENLFDAIGLHNVPSSRSFALLEREPDFELTADRALARFNIEPIRIEGREDFALFCKRLIGEAGRRRELPTADGGKVEVRPSILELRLRNIGPFSEATIQFQSDWTIILGNNGAGKSTILRAIALVLAGTDRESQRLARHLLKRGKRSGMIELLVNAVPQPVTYRIALSQEGNRVNVDGTVSPLQAGAMVAFGFPAVRGVVLRNMMEPQTLEPDPLPRIADVMPLLDGGPDLRMQDLKLWIRQTSALAENEKATPKDRQRARAMVETFFRILDEMAPGFELSFSHVDAKTGEILLKTSDGKIPIDYASQGMISMMGWLGILLQRLYDINEGMADPATAEAVLLVDEIDSHLHPEWQQSFVPVLRKTFPCLQVIATTHSALMVGSLEEKEVVKVVRTPAGLEIHALDKSYQGYRVDQILTDAPFDMASTRGLGWEVLRDEYAALLGKSNRTSQEEQRYLELDALMDEVPPPFEQRSDRDAYGRSLARIDREIKARGVKGGGATDDRPA